jgi:hypothetical protein
MSKRKPRHCNSNFSSATKPADLPVLIRRSCGRALRKIRAVRMEEDTFGPARRVKVVWLQGEEEKFMSYFRTLEECLIVDATYKRAKARRKGEE